MSFCKHCGEPITWLKNREGKYIPCNPKAIYYRINPYGGTTLVTLEGETIRGDEVDPSQAVSWGYVPHWKTCAASDRSKGRW